VGGTVIVATAGHVDHGKSALVEALSGQVMDRAPEARRRGMTIDLGFAPAELPGGAMVELIDVPGHEGFIRTMVAGASGIDAALLVVAADEGVMPQTSEHLAVLEFLGIPDVIPVVTRCDLVEPEWIELVVAELAERLGRSTVRFTRSVPVSVRDGRGLDDVRQLLATLAASARERPVEDLFRLPVDRVLSIAGAGTVVAGTCWSGAIEVGAEVRLAPGTLAARIRSIQSQGSGMSVGRSGRRIALSLAGVERREVHRGMTVLAERCSWEGTRALDALLTPAYGSALPARRTRVRIHLGTDDAMGWVTPAAPALSGESMVARLTVDRPIVARGGDRFVIRRAGAGTIAGGEVLDPYAERGRTWPAGLVSAGAAERVQALVERRASGLALDAAAVVTGLTPAALAREVRAASAFQRVGDRVIASSRIDSAADGMLEALAAFHREHPAERGMPLETLRRAGGLDPHLAEAALVRLRASEALGVVDGLACRRGFRPRVTGGDAAVGALVERIAAAGLMPPSVSELVAETRRQDTPAMLRLATADGKLEEVERDRYFARTALDAFVGIIMNEGRAGPLSIARLRERLGISRKYLIPLLEWSDRKGYTVRNGDIRRAGPGSPVPARSN